MSPAVVIAASPMNLVPFPAPSSQEGRCTACLAGVWLDTTAQVLVGLHGPLALVLCPTCLRQYLRAWAAGGGSR